MASGRLLCFILGCVVFVCPSGLFVPCTALGDDDPIPREILQNRAVGRWSKAHKQLEEFLARHPKHVEAWVHLGAVNEDLSRFGAARDCYETALRLDPGSAVARRNLEQLDAAKSINIPVRPPVTARHAIREQGLRALKSGRPAEALKSFRVLHGLAPLHPGPRLLQALAWERLGEHDRALREYRRLVRAFPYFAEARVNLIILLAKLRKYDEARRVAVASVDRHPDDRRIRYLAQSLRWRGSPKTRDDGVLSAREDWAR